MFRTQFDSHDRVHLNPGDRVKDVYSPFFDDRGVLSLEVSGQENLYQYIQSFKESTDIHVLLKRFVNGEADALSQAQGFYMDASDMPKTYMEVLNSVIAGENAFNSLPAEVKRQFNNSFSEWLASFESPDFLSKMGLVRPESSEVSQSDSQVADFAGVSPSPGSTLASTDSSGDAASIV